MDQPFATSAAAAADPTAQAEGVAGPTAPPASAYRRLEQRFARLSALSDIAGILDWDMQTMMPRGAAEGRTEQMATLHVLSHELLTAAEVPVLLAEAEAVSGGLDRWQAANLREMRRSYELAAAVPADLVEACSRAESRCEMIWRSARANDDFESLRPALQEVLTCKRRVGEARGAVLDCTPYDALMEEYEPGLRAETVETLFEDLGAFLRAVLPEILEKQAARGGGVRPRGPFPQRLQREIGEHLIRTVGFDFDCGRLDVSLHPFCGGATGDVRITTRYDEENFASALMGMLHETGHALYEQGLPHDWRAQPVGQARGLAMHESQSLLVEMQASRSHAFLRFAAPLLRSTFGSEDPAWDPDNLHRFYNEVRPGLIRVDADEVTYPAHIILRFRLERALIAGDLTLAELPGAWRDGMAELLGVVVPDDRSGCLQDIHWPGGAWGYFPTYSLGALIAAQLFQAACRDRPEIPESLSAGNFVPLIGWLRTAVHAKGSLLSTADLLREATGEPLNVAHFKAHVRKRYLDA